MYAVSISRIDYDKNTEIILRANQIINDENKKIKIFGSENRFYIYKAPRQHLYNTLIRDTKEMIKYQSKPADRLFTINDCRWTQ